MSGRGRGTPPLPPPPPPHQQPPPPPCTTCRQLGVHCDDVDQACRAFGFPQVENAILNSEPLYRSGIAQFIIGLARIQQPPTSGRGRGRSTGRACGLCINLETQECGPSCQMAPYFPLSIANQIKDAIRLFGILQIFQVFFSFHPHFATGVQSILHQTRNLTSRGWPYIHAAGGQAIGSSSGYGASSTRVVSTEFGTGSGHTGQENEARPAFGLERASSSKGDATTADILTGLVREMVARQVFGPGRASSGADASAEFGTGSGQEDGARPAFGLGRASSSKGDATTADILTGLVREMVARQVFGPGRASSNVDVSAEFGTGSGQENGARPVFGLGRESSSKDDARTADLLTGLGREMEARRQVMGSGRASSSSVDVSTELRLSPSQEMEVRRVLAGSSKDATAGFEQLGTESGQGSETGPGQGAEARVKRVKNATTEFEQLGTGPGQERETVFAQPETWSDRTGLSKDATTEFEQLGSTEPGQEMEPVYGLDSPGQEMESRRRSNTASSSKDTEFGSGSSSGSKG